MITNKQNRPMESRRGSVLVVAVILATVMAMGIGSFMQLAQSQNRSANISFYSNNSLNLAEGGVEKALYAINFDEWDGWTISGNVATLTPVELDLGSNRVGIMRVQVTDFETNPVVIAEGRTLPPNLPPVTKQVEVRLTRRSLFANGITSRQGVTFSGGNAWVGSYKSSKGDPSASNTFDNGSVASISVAANAIDLSNSTVYGYVATGGSMPYVGSNGRIYGADTPAGVQIDPNRVALDFASDFPDIEEPSTSLNLPIINSNTTLGTPGGPHVSYLVNAITIAGHSTLRIDGPVTLVVEGEVRVSGNASIVVTANGKLEMYARNNVDIAGNGTVNATTYPQNLLIYGLKSSGQTISISGGSQLRAAIYAPKANVAISGTGLVLGAVVGNRVNLNGNVNFYYDEDLAEYGMDKTFRLDRWRELHFAADRFVFAE